MEIVYEEPHTNLIHSTNSDIYYHLRKRRIRRLRMKSRKFKDLISAMLVVKEMPSLSENFKVSNVTSYNFTKG